MISTARRHQQPFFYFHNYAVSITRRSIKLILLLFAWNLSFFSSSQQRSFILVAAKEIVATHEWQKIKDGDTLPAGLEIRMNLGEEGGKWARLPPSSDTDKREKQSDVGTANQQQQPHNPPRCGPSCKERLSKYKGKAGLRGTRKDDNSQEEKNEEQDIIVEDHRNYLERSPENATVLSSLLVPVFAIIGLITGVLTAGKIRRTTKIGMHEL